MNSISNLNLIYILIAAVILLTITVLIIDIINHKKRNNINEEVIIEGTKPVEEFLEENNINTSNDNLKEIIDNNQNIQTNIQKEPVITETTSDSNEATKELQKITEDLIAKETNKQQSNETLNPPDENISLTEFEKEQEESAIISYNELLKKGDELYDKNETTQYNDEGNEPITIDQLREKFNTNNIDKEELENTIELTLNNDKDNISQNDISIKTPSTSNDLNKFKSSPVISPVYGISKDNTKANTNSDIELEQTADLQKLDEELKKTNEFLMILKELQKKLD